MKSLQSQGLEITTVYDIGAWNGSWSKQFKESACPGADFILFEANPAYRKDLAATGFLHMCGMALSNPGRESVEFYNGTNTGDSYYKETTAFYDNQGTVSLPCTTLDAVKAEYDLPTPQFMKLDTQGSELDILAGSVGFLRDVDVVYTKCPIVRYNSGAPTIDEYLSFFAEHRFIPIDVFKVHRFEETLLQIDIMFMREETKNEYLGPNHAIRPFS